MSSIDDRPVLTDYNFSGMTEDRGREEPSMDRSSSYHFHIASNHKLLLQGCSAALLVDAGVGRSGRSGGRSVTVTGGFCSEDVLSAR
jgi:hypothetical protein